jgi:type I restriction enzyme S subunit
VSSAGPVPQNPGVDGFAAAHQGWSRADLWPESLPLGWHACALKRHLVSLRDGTHGSFDRVQSGVPLLSAKNITEDGRLEVTESESLIAVEDWEEIHRSGYLRLGDLLVTIVGTIGHAAVFEGPEPVAFQRSVAVLRPDSDTLVRFLFYLVQSAYFRHGLLARVKQSAQGGVYLGDLGGVVGAFAPATEQRAIADFLDRETAKIDALIAKKERLIELLQEKRTALISQAVTKGLDPKVPMKDSGIEWLGRIPAHWRVMRLKFAVVQKPDAIKTGPFGSQLLLSEMAGGDVKVYTQANVVDHDLDEGSSFISSDKYEELRAFTVYPGDILVTTRGTIGRCAIVPDGAKLGILHPCLMRVQPNPKKVLREFLAYLIEDSWLLRTQLLFRSNATTIDVIYSNTMRDVKIPVPPVDEQHQIVGYLQSWTSRINTTIARVMEGIDTLREYRPAIISAAVTGKIDVREAAS